MADNQIITTEDGSHSLQSHQFGVSYHSIHGALQESQHVFMQAGLSPWVTRENIYSIKVLEMGFGTGLNAYLVYLLAQNHPALDFHFYTVEAYPISAQTIAQLNYEQLLEQEGEGGFQRIHEAPWGQDIQLSANFTLHKEQGNFLDCPIPQNWANTIFFDAFAPTAQPELWETGALTRCHEALIPTGNLVTYCAKGVVKRTLKSLGFTVEALPGPPGKREMTRATKDSTSPPT